MSPKGRPKKKDTLTNLWVVEQYYHGDDATQSWGKPLEVCYSEKSAKDRMELEAKLYAEDLECPEIIRDTHNMITVKPYNGVIFCPSMDFWYYHCILVED